MIRGIASGLFAALLPFAAAAAQQAKHVAYPQRDILSPFRSPSEVHAPPDRLFALLRQMRQIAEDRSSRKSFDDNGREVVDDERWRLARREVELLGIDAGYLATLMRYSKNGDDRATAFYAAFLCTNIDYVLNLIAHIPGEPWRTTREAAMPRAVEFCKVHLTRRYGQLSDEQKRAMMLPKPGTPEARARGITRAPLDADPLHGLNLLPFFQLLDGDDALDQAQGLWFLAQVFPLRMDLALAWLEPALPRVQQLLLADDAKVVQQAVALLQTIAPPDLAPLPADADNAARLTWAKRAEYGMFPPIRNLNDAIVQMQPSAERDAVAAAARAAIAASGTGEPAHGKTKAGLPFRGFKITHVPDELKVLAIPQGAVITTINGAPITDAASLDRTVRELLDQLGHPRRLFVEYVLQGDSHAIEYRLL
jgi:hypothetical protein